MKRLISLLILLSIVIAAPVSAEEIRLTTIVPDQTILRAKKGAIGETYSNPATIPDSSIPASALLVEGNVGIGTGTTSLTEKLTVSGNTKISGYMLLPPTSQPASPQPGMIYYDTSTNVMRYYKGGASPQWVDLSGGGGGAFQAPVICVTGYDYLASSDGFVMAQHRKGVVGWSTDGPSPFGVGASINQNAVTGDSSCISFPVKKGSYWRVEKSGSADAYVLWWRTQ
ncbi:MAG: hypothetical protein A3K16_01625 [Omnitrophica bacterium RIFCSPLOWO2_01_FULL_45_24]|nr:MAG: hypothetical protein A3K16_01625 [Omnitrophica bacterium RIFCSPLOWO2_01_FULL_45_24]